MSMCTSECVCLCVSCVCVYRYVSAYIGLCESLCVSVYSGVCMCLSVLGVCVYGSLCVFLKAGVCAGTEERTLRVEDSELPL